MNGATQFVGAAATDGPVNRPEHARRFLQEYRRQLTHQIAIIVDAREQPRAIEHRLSAEAPILLDG